MKGYIAKIKICYDFQSLSLATEGKKNVKPTKNKMIFLRTTYVDQIFAY